MFKSLLLATLTLSSSFGFAGQQELFSIAKKSLEHNIIELSDGGVVRAGAHQFASLWTRDFCFASRGLRAIGRDDVTANHLSRLLNALRDDGLVPRVLDSKASWKRVARYSLVPFRPDSPDVKDELKPEYKGEHGTIAIDSNALVLITAYEYLISTEDMAWFDQHQEALRNVLDFYRPYFNEGLIKQDKYSDWQDSVKRNTATFFTNFLVWKALNHYKQFAAFNIDQKTVDLFRSNLDKTFFDQEMGLYKSLDHGDWVSLEGILYALEDEEFLESSKKKSLYQALTKHPLWGAVPGRATYPSYKRKEISYTTKVVGLRSYHDGLVWPWLTAFSAKVAKLMGDDLAVRRITMQLSDWAKRDGAINEVMDPKKKMRPVKRMFYTSEAPFSWGAGFVLDMLNQKED